MDKTEQHCIKFNIKKSEPLNELLCTSVSSTCSSGTIDSNLEDLNSAELNKPQVVESKKRKISQGDIQPASTLDSLEPNLKKQHKTKKNSTRPSNFYDLNIF